MVSSCSHGKESYSVVPTNRQVIDDRRTKNWSTGCSDTKDMVSSCSHGKESYSAVPTKDRPSMCSTQRGQPVLKLPAKEKFSGCALTKES
jgi:hypothetical protein